MIAPRDEKPSPESNGHDPEWQLVWRKGYETTEPKEKPEPPKRRTNWLAFVLVFLGVVAAVSSVCEWAQEAEAAELLERLESDMERVKRYFQERGISLPDR